MQSFQFNTLQFEIYAKIIDWVSHNSQECTGYFIWLQIMGLVLVETRTQITRWMGNGIVYRIYRLMLAVINDVHEQVS